MIQLTNVSKVYGKGATAFYALKEINLELPKSTSVAIVGRSGSGKSTLMHVMSGLDRPQSGSIVIDGQNILQFTPKQMDAFRSQKMGFIFQSFFVQADETCLTNVSLPLEISGANPNDRSRLIEEALAKVELTDKKQVKARDLSGGQKQRLAIARAIVNSPSIIFADEPTGNLDSTTGKVIEDLLFSFNKQLGSTLIIVTHDPELAARCDMQVHLLDGQIEKIIPSRSPSTQKQGVVTNAL
ncbi:MAG TPA: ABC transporter ATP-binding protein [Verrucomicrobiae bacterium]|nr:ABC transporter ATP-binding protein [Verrucomicrobiae bacterium]